MSEQQLFFQNILENMHDGVMTLDGEGRITMFNQAAGDILGVPRDEVAGRGFAEVFMLELEGNDAFNQAILDAVYQAAIGSTALVDFTRPAGDTVHLAVTSSYLRRPEGGKTGDGQGIIVVFNDITEVQKLRNAEKELNRQLIAACRKAEESNASLNTALRKVQIIRVMVTSFVLLLFLGLGLYYWNKSPVAVVAQSSGFTEGPMRRMPGVGGGPAVEVAGGQEVTASVSMSGTLEPVEKIHVVAPFNASVEKIFCQYGDEVKKGDPLLLLETSEFEVEVRNAEAEYIKALQAYNELKDWSESNEMARAKRSLMKARRELDVNRRKLDEAQLLFDKGIVSGNELDGAKAAVQNGELELKAADEDLATVKSKGGAANVRVAEMALMNARTKKETLEAKLRRGEIRAPESGVIMLGGAEGGKQAKPLEKGAPVKEGDVLLSVGNLAGLTVRADVDEIDVGKIGIGQKVRVTGDAFPGVTLAGRVSAVSSQARQGGMGAIGVPTFEVMVTISEIPAAVRRQIRLGMTATMEVQVYENKDALMVPIDAVEVADGKAKVRVRDKATGEVREVPVKTGTTNVTSVEIKSGISAGDQVLTGKDAGHGGGEAGR